MPNWWEQQIDPTRVGQVGSEFGRYRPIQRPTVATPQTPTANPAIADAVKQALGTGVDTISRTQMPLAPQGVSVGNMFDELTKPRDAQLDQQLSDSSGG